MGQVNGEITQVLQPEVAEVVPSTFLASAVNGSVSLSGSYNRPGEIPDTIGLKAERRQTWTG